MNNIQRFIYLCAFFIPIGIFAQNVSGTIKEAESGLTLSDVTITNESTLSEAVSDSIGFFTIEANAGDVLVFSAFGKDDLQITYNGEPQLNLSMGNSTQTKLDEVLVIGYGTTTYKDATGSVVGVTSKDFNEGLVTAPEQLLTGKVAGLTVTSGGGQPGSGSTIRIRGGSSLNANNDPLFVVDGVPMNNGASIAGSSNPLNFINPDDIESMSVLKDASATAIYGARASNGVIIITTKRGKKGQKMKISFNSSVSVQHKTKEIDVFSADQFRTEVMARGTESSQLLLGNYNTKWQDKIYKVAFGFDNNLGISGSWKNLPYRISFGYTNQDGILKTGNFERTTASIGLSPSFLDNHLNVDMNVRGSVENNKFADDGAIGAAMRFDPTKPVYNVWQMFGGYYEWLNSAGSPNPNATRNPLALLYLNDNTAQNLRSVGNVKFEYKVHGFEDLKAVVNMGYDYSESDGNQIQPEYAAANFAQGGLHKTYKQRRRNLLFDSYLNYNKYVESIKSKFDVTAGYSYQSFDYYNMTYDQNYAGTLDNAIRTLDKYPNVLIGFFGRLNYTFDDIYALTFTLRNDGSSRFSDDNRWGLFPSAAFAWNVSEYKFLKDSKTVSNLKLRLGYGVTGQENINSSYPYLPIKTYSNAQSMYPLGSVMVPSLRPNIFDPNIKWEETTTYNIGLDFGFFNNRVSGSVDVYKKDTDDLLQEVSVAMPALNNRITTNVGSMENKGIEMVLTVDVIDTKDFQWTVSANATYNKNEIKKISLFDNPDFRGVLTGGITGGNGNNIQINSVGNSAQSFYVYSQVYDENGKPIAGVYEDLNKDGIINELDLRQYHSARPDWTLGFNSNLTYKNWDFGFSARASLGNYMYNNVQSDMGNFSSLLGANGFLNNVTTDALNTGFTTPYYFSDYYVQDASFLKLDYVTLGYTFKKLLGNKLDMRFYGTCQNVFVITNYSGIDPEISNGIDNQLYPRPRTYMFGLNVNF